ncbi:response regulator transcription factor [Candidatus Magnetaquicoccus inordinatus]|uniref:response regulator transcription factor n=1 Tax=Candidatus Magnetaquicoccus inordinatus TaxID=2496818 RepID=UPI00102D0E16|nr:response regulator [Candidatus Magnetaquicoccus inordinatus]
MANILVVEDDEEMCSLMLTILSQAGHEVHSVGDGVEALRQVNKEHYDLLITDIFMPEMDGFTLLRAIRDLPVQVLAISAGFQNVTSVMSLCMAGALGAVTMSKPIRGEQLLQKVEEMLHSPLPLALRRKEAWGV